MLNNAELARRSLLGFGEMVALLGRWNAGTDAVIRRTDAIGARIAAAADNHWLDAVIVPYKVNPPADSPELPHCLWTVADAVPGRVEDPEIATPCMGIVLDDPLLEGDVTELNVERPSLEVLGNVNEHAYGGSGFAPLVSTLRDERIRTYGLREKGAFVCVALTLAIGDDFSIQFVATEPDHRRRGLASGLLRTVLATAKNQGMRSATLQASPDGLSVYERLGFRSVALLKGYLRAGSSA